MAALGDDREIRLPPHRRQQVERLKAAYRACETPMQRIAVLNDGSFGSVVTRVLAAIELHDNNESEGQS